MLNNISLDVGKREVLGIVGESGCGKTTLGLSVIGLLPARISRYLEDSEIWFGDKNLLKLSESQLEKVRGSGITMIFQEPMTSLNPALTIGDQISESIYVRLEREASHEDRKTVKNEVVEALRLVRIPDPERILNVYPHQLSGGMRQRAMIAMALASKPSLIIADEPGSALDVTTQIQIIRLMRDLIHEVGTSFLFITHDLGVIGEIADRVAVMYAGEIVEEASVYELFERPLHPYTQGLMSSLVMKGKEGEKLEALPGAPPSLANPPTGCRFHPRCKFAMDKCRQMEPGLREADPGHKVSCFLYE